MATAVLVTLLLCQLSLSEHGVALGSAAAASPRPAACRFEVTGPGPRPQTLWDRARTPGAGRYCAALARGYGRLAHDPSAALEAAQDAERAWAGQAASMVLRGRALLRLGRANEAYELLAGARRLARHSLDAPSGLHELARAAAITGHSSEARDAYRALVPQASLLASDAQRQQVFVEAASWVMGVGAAGLDEAIGYLAEARRKSVAPGYRAFVLGALALSLDRQGEIDQARGVAVEAGGAAAVASLLPDSDAVLETGGATGSAAGPVTPPRLGPGPVIALAEIHAMAAVLAQAEVPEIAVDHWQEFLRLVGDGGSVWKEHAEDRLRRLSAPRRAGRGR